MKKLSLNLDDLQVESFTTDGAAAERGTVHAAQAYCGYCCCCCCCCTCAASCGGTCWGQYTCPGYFTCDGSCYDPTCPGGYSCDYTCQDGCTQWNSCNGSCDSCWSCYYTECDCGPSYYAVAAGEDRIPAC